MSEQYRGSIKQSFAWWDAAGADLPVGLFNDFNEKYKAWEVRRGFKSEDNESNPEPSRPLRGSARTAKLAFESKKRMLAKEAAKLAKKNLTKKLSPTKFSPEIVGKVYTSDANAKRRIKQYILANHLIIPADYEFGVSKIDWGKYEITGCRKQTKK